MISVPTRDAVGCFRRMPERNGTKNDIDPVDDASWHAHASAGAAIRLTKKDGKTAAEVVWANRELRMNVPAAILVDGQLFGSTDKTLFAADLQSGKRDWVRRGFPNASCIHADGKLIILDENGQLTPATATPRKRNVHSQCTVTERHSFTVPTLVDTTLYIRDRKHIMVLDLGKPKIGETG